MYMRENTLAVNSEPTTELYREENAAGVFVFQAKVTPPEPQVRRRQSAFDRDKSVSPEDRAQATKIARARRLLKSLRIIHETRDPALFRTRHRIALLTAAGNLLAIANSDVKDKLAITDLQDWAGAFVADATQTELARAYEAIMQDEGFRTIPRPPDIGFDLELDKLHWFRAGRPWGVHPANLSTAEVKKVQRDAKKARDKERAAAKRAASGATPRSMSVLAIARELGTSRPTLYKRMREAGFDNATEFYSFVAPNNNKNYTGDESVKPSARPTASAAPVGDDADLILRHPSATFPQSSKSSHWRAAPKPTRRKPELVKSKETAMPSNVIDFAPILADPERREKLARLFNVVANSFSKSEPKAANRAR